MERARADSLSKENSMADEKQTTNTPTTPATPASGSAPARSSRSPFPPRGGAGRGGPRGGGKDGGRRPGGPRGERAKPEFDQKSLEVRRVARVVAGGRRFSFSVAMVIGDRKGRVGVGTGKAGDTALAINKAIRSAKKSMIKIKLNKQGSLPQREAGRTG